MIKKVLTWLGIAFVVFFVVTNPRGAADFVGAIGGWVASAFRSVGVFVADLAKKF